MSWIIDLLKDIPQSAVLKEKIALVDFKLAETEKELLLCEQMRTADAARIKEIETQLQEANIRIQQLEQEITVVRNEKQQLQAESYKTQKLTHTENLLDEKKQQILLALHQHQSLAIREMASVTQMQVTELEFNVEELRKERYITYAQRRVGQPKKYKLDQEGRKYLIEHHLI
ncbi:MAG: hypothetical protein HY231_16175 [Acidobacteria bacterium]|nr:hypothetical protein [Acidobacteriota bacterium]